MSERMAVRMSRNLRAAALRLSVGSTKRSVRLETRDRPCNFLCSMAALSMTNYMHNSDVSATWLQHGLASSCISWNLSGSYQIYYPTHCVLKAELEVAGITEGPVFRPVARSGRVRSRSTIRSVSR